MKNLNLHQVVGLYALIGLGLVISAFILEHNFGAEPCTMCWWQRYTHWAIAGIAILGYFLSSKISPRLVLILIMLAVVLSGGIGAYQGLGQLGIIELPAICGGAGIEISNNIDNFMASLNNFKAPPRCDEVNFTIFQLSLAWWNVIVMSSLFITGIFYLYIRKK